MRIVSTVRIGIILFKGKSVSNPPSFIFQVKIYNNNLFSVSMIKHNGIKMASFLSNYKSFPYIVFNPGQ